jgi:phosphatidylserine/phosphatidylglycerophosphate/cardiolipin synthase-like enzyme
MKAVAFSNNDIAVVAWTFDGKLNGCLGFAVYRIDVQAGTETCLPAMATFQNQSAAAGRTTADDPVQKFFWKDVYAKRGGTYKYKIVPLGGTPGSLQPMPYGPLISNQIQLTANYGALSAYFNRGILATQATAKAINATPGGGQMADKLKPHIYKVGDPLRNDLAGQMIEALTTLPDEALQNRDELHCAFYEFDDPEVIAHLDPLKGSLKLILSNMPGTTTDPTTGKEVKTNDTYADERAAIKATGAVVQDRFMAGNHIGHNKFQVLLQNGVPQAALFGSTNVTAHGLCAQTNNTIIARSAGVAAAYDAYWTRLSQDTLPSGKVTGPQATPLRTADAKGPTTVQLEDGSGTVDLWFSPNTPKARASKPGANEPCPPDLQELFKLISEAQQAILFLVFEPGKPSIVDAIAAAQKANPSLFVRGAVTDAGAAGEFYTAVNGISAPATKPKKGDPKPPLPEDYRVIHTRGITKGDAFNQWTQELNQAGHAVIHDKIVVIDPFSDNCVVAMGSHNDGYKASYNNDENMAIIKGHRAVAEAYAAHCLDVYDHYAWRYYLQTENTKAWHFLAADDSWQNSYFSAGNQVKSSELNFWLGASPKGDALPTPHDDGSTRARPALQRQTGGVSPAVGPHAVKPSKRAKPGTGAKPAKRAKTTKQATSAKQAKTSKKVKPAKRARKDD